MAIRFYSKLIFLMVASLSSVNSSAARVNPLVGKSTATGPAYFDSTKPPPQRPPIRTERYVPENIKVGSGQQVQ